MISQCGLPPGGTANGMTWKPLELTICWVGRFAFELHQINYAWTDLDQLGRGGWREAERIVHFRERREWVGRLAAC
jgi:hypothetical protein